MHPTPQEQLRVSAAIIAEVAADEQVPPAARQRLTLAAGQLRRLAGNVSARLAFLHEDNLSTEALLHGLAQLVGPNAVGIADADADADADAGSLAPAPQMPLLPAHDDLSLLGEARVHERNKALRAELSALIGRLPDGPAGDAARVRIAAHLRARTRADPALNRPRGATRS